jgi:hypothetical protein
MQGNELSSVNNQLVFGYFTTRTVSQFFAITQVHCKANSLLATFYRSHRGRRFDRDSFSELYGNQLRLTNSSLVSLASTSSVKPIRKTRRIRSVFLC